MSFSIAIQPDEVLLDGERRESYSDRWLEVARRLGHDARLVDVWRPGIIDELRHCDGFMWRFLHPIAFRRLAHRLLPTIEKQMNLHVFPDWRTAWTYDDKISQFYLLTAAGIPIPKTWILWDYVDAVEFARAARYPLVLKLAGGASSENVRLIRTAAEALQWIDLLFDRGVQRLEDIDELPFSPTRRIRASAKVLLTGKPPRWKHRDNAVEVHNNYFLAQEFLDGNAFDTRVTVIGNRAFAFRRFNRPDDFRSSGSGDFDLDPKRIDQEWIRLAFRTAQALGTQSIAIDGLMRGEQRVIGEVSYTYVSWVVESCPGRWFLQGSPDSGELTWHEGHLKPEDAILEDFLAALAARGTTGGGRGA